PPTPHSTSPRHVSASPPPPPPPPSPFPYTTLFRSDHSRNTLDLSVVPAVQRLSHLPIIVDPSHGTGQRTKVTPLSRAAIAREWRDRKSTRLNSSHQIISYAVFCLKKKRQRDHRHGD